MVRVYPDIATPELFGDEPVLIARRSRVPVYISPDRPEAARALLAAHPEVNVLVSDDGLQHYALARDVELAVIDGERRFGNGLLLPSGPLREPVSRWLKQVDAWSSRRQRPWSSTACAPHLRDARWRASASRAGVDQDLAPRSSRWMARGDRWRAAGIGNPGVSSTTSALGVQARTRVFDDHHHYQPADLKLPGAEIVLMTEKDAVKCAAFADARMWFLRVEASLPAEFEDFLLTRINQARRSADGPQAA